MVASKRGNSPAGRFPELGCLGKAARRIALEKGLTLKEAREKSGISNSAWFSAMSGKTLPSMETFFAIAYGLGVLPEELIGQMRAERTRIREGA